MRVLTKSLVVTALTLLTLPIAAQAADLDYGYAPPPPPPVVYEQRGYQPPPPPVVEYVEPLRPFYPRPYRHFDTGFYTGPRFYPRPFHRPYGPYFGERRFGY